MGGPNPIQTGINKMAEGGIQPSPALAPQQPTSQQPTLPAPTGVSATVRPDRSLLVELANQGLADKGKVSFEQLPQQQQDNLLKVLEQNYMKMKGLDK